MLDIVKHIEIDGTEYPIAYTFNVMEAIQDKYDTIENWVNALQPPKGVEPKIKDIKWTFTQFINEGIDIENENKGEKRPFITEKQVGRLISAVGMNEMTKAMKSVTSASTKTDDIKNE